VKPVDDCGGGRIAAGVILAGERGMNKYSDEMNFHVQSTSKLCFLLAGINPLDG
jgi:hypothetical protein